MGLIIILVLVGLVVSYVLAEEFMEIASKKGQKYMPYPAFDRSFQMYYNEGKKDMKGQTYL